MKHYRLLLFLLICVNASLKSQISFSNYQTNPTYSPGEVITIADVNNDGRNDVIMGTGCGPYQNKDFRLYVYYQTNTGSLSAPVKYLYVDSLSSPFKALKCISPGDLNHDNLTDIVIGFSDSIAIFYQNSTHTFNAPVKYKSGLTVDGVKTGDLNNDGLTDIAVSHWSANYIRVFYQHTSGFTTTDYPAIQGTHNEIEIGDMNKDNLNDVVLKSGDVFRGINIYTQTLAGGLDSAVSYSAYSTSLQGIGLGDLNNDGKPDVVGTHYDNLPSGDVSLWFQQTIPNILQTPETILPANNGAGPVETGDLDCDGKNEIIVSNMSSVSVYSQNASGVYTTYQSFFVISGGAGLPKPQSLAIGDINGDGKKDVVISDFTFGLVYLINNTAPHFSNYNISSITSSLIYSTVQHTHSYYIQRHTDTLTHYLITYTDSFNVEQTYNLESISIDTAKTATSVMCGVTYSNTVINSHIITNITGQSSDTTHLSLTVDTVFILSVPGIFKPDYSITIFPNPASRDVQITSNTFMESILVEDLQGRIIYKKECGSNRAILYKEELGGGGVYFITVTLSDAVKIRRKVILLN